MINFDKFKDGKSKIITMSYDDGTIHDIRLCEIFDKYGIRGTFHINSAFIGHDGYLTEKDISEGFKNHEISLHTCTHPYMNHIPNESMIYQVMEDRKKLESLTGCIVKGLSYPYGAYNAHVIDMLKMMGVVYARTTVTHHGFDLPEDFMAWHATCHHHDALEDSKKFLSLLEQKYRHHLLYIWGHSYEFDRENNWEEVEEVCKLIGGNEDIWCATNIEIYNYVTAVKRLEFSADVRSIHNPSAIDVWVSYDHDTVKVPAGKTVRV